MDAKDFTIRLKKIKAEILALKQSYKYGIGRADFVFNKFYKTFDTTGQKNMRLTASFNSDTMPFCQLWVDNLYFDNILVNWASGVLTVDHTLTVYSTGYEFNIAIVMSAVPTAISWEEV